jgi:thioester reductase-like protein
MSDADTESTAEEGSSQTALGAGPEDAIDPDLLDGDVLMTGFPGFLASRLVREMFAYGPEGTLFFLVEPRYRQEAERRMETIEAEFPGFEGDWEIVSGDITDEQLGFDEETYEDLADRVNVVWHLAAIYDLAVAEAVAYRVNVRGTIHVLDFCEQCDDLQRLNYISTSYVSGTRGGTVYEDELDEGQGHNNHYESTKFWAEVEVQRRRSKLPTAIFRPGIVVGDSQTGETDKYDGPYYLMRLLHKLPNWMPVPNIGEGDCVVNLVPVDYVTETMAFLGLQEGADGQVYQVADPQPMKARDIFSMILDCMDRAPAIGRVPAGLANVALGNEQVSSFAELPREALIYFNHGARYDTSNVDRALEGTPIRCPHLSTYMQTLVDYFLRHPDRPEGGKH